MARILLLGALSCAIAIGCGAKPDAAVPEEDPQFTADYVDDYENDVDEQAAQEQEQALLDQLDDLDDVEVLDDAPTSPGFSTTGYDTKNVPPKRPPHGPLTIMQDDPHFKGITGTDHDQEAQKNLTIARGLGVRIVRMGVSWRGATETKWDYMATTKPNFTATDPDNYDWSDYDRLADEARALGMQVMITISAPMPFWASEEPQHCLDQYTADQALPPEQRTFWSCSWKPDVRMYAQFVTAVARHFKSTGARIWGWTVWNEPNIGAFLSDEPNTDDHAMRYRKMWFAARKAIRKTAGVRARVLFGDNANGGPDPTDARYHMLRQSLCIRINGTPFTGKQYKDCPDAPRVVQASGYAFHPYSSTPKEFAGSIAAIETIMDGAEKNKRLRAGRGVYLTEHGFLTGEAKDGDVLGGALVVTPENQAIYDDLAVHVASSDPRIKTFAQYELYDDGRGTWDCGLMHPDGTPKPALPSFKVAIDVKKSSTSGKVDVFTLARLASNTPVVVAVKRSATDTWHDLDGISTDALGYGSKTFDATGVYAWSAHYLGDSSRAVANP